MPPDSGSTRSSRRSVSCTKSSSSSARSRITACGQVEVAAVDEQVLADGQLGVEGVLLRHDAEPGADLRAVGRGVHAEDPQRAAGRPARRSRSSAWSSSCRRRWGRGSRRPRPAATSKSMPSTATKSPKRLETAGLDEGSSLEVRHQGSGPYRRLTLAGSAPRTSPDAPRGRYRRRARLSRCGGSSTPSPRAVAGCLLRPGCCEAEDE